VRRSILCLGLVIAFGATACGDPMGNDASGLMNAVSAALTASAQSDGSISGPFSFDDTMVGCITDAVLSDDASREKLQTAFDDGAKGEKLLDAVGDAESNGALTRPVLGCICPDLLAGMMVTSVVDGSDDYGRKN